MSPRNSIKSFEQNYIPEPNSGCWIWLGYTISDTPPKEYGRYNWYDYKRKKMAQKMAHAISYELYIGAIPEGKEIDHRCRNTLCVNPEHLEPVTHIENCRRSFAATKTHCIHGHPYANGMEVYVRNDAHGKQYRRCLTCYKLKYPGTKKR